MRRRTITAPVAKLGLLLAGAALVAEAHRLLEGNGLALAHHAFHVAFGVGAMLVLVGYVVHEVRRNGWPGFSWRLRQPRQYGCPGTGTAPVRVDPLLVPSGGAHPCDPTIPVAAATREAGCRRPGHGSRTRRRA